MQHSLFQSETCQNYYWKKQGDIQNENLLLTLLNSNGIIVRENDFNNWIIYVLQIIKSKNLLCDGTNLKILWNWLFYMFNDLIIRLVLAKFKMSLHEYNLLMKAYNYL